MSSERFAMPRRPWRRWLRWLRDDLETWALERLVYVLWPALVGWCVGVVLVALAGWSASTSAPFAVLGGAFGELVRRRSCGDA